MASRPGNTHAIRVVPNPGVGSEPDKRFNSSIGMYLKPGKPKRWLTTDEIALLERLAEAGTTRAEQAATIGISASVLSDRMKDQPGVYAAIERGSARMHVSLRRKQLAIAMTDGHPAQATMLIWLGKAVLGQSERINLKIETTSEALERLKAIWPELNDEELAQLSAAIDVEARSVDGGSEGDDAQGAAESEGGDAPEAVQSGG